MKKSLITLTVMLTAAALTAVFSGPAMAKVTGRCDNCHTMHNSQGGSAMATDGSSPELGTPPYGTLLTDTCVGCHSGVVVTDAYYNLGGCNVPIVNHTGGSGPTNYLAGGNFWWVADNGGNEDTKGHNVLGISGEDAHLTLSGPQEAPGNQQGGMCKTAGCHGSLARENTHVPELGSGCEGCHLRVRHHADDRGDPVTGSYRVTTEDQGWYRFLAAHSGNHVKPFGVHGIEDVDWQQLSKASANKHNEYRGSAGGNETYTTLNDAQNPTVTAFCCGCHGEFHIQEESGSWIRHPSDAVLPDRDPDSEYEAYTKYDPLAPVARDSLTAVSPSVQANSDMVMCLSCHRPHGSPYADLLRWKYTGDGGCEAQGESECGCFVCHTQKGTYSNP
ncbi:MAG: hypothetical protein IMF10_01130 [Proteobacteria bacterium]|nr:hypothetical protein [Pseudomonadota bacterium]